jgi:aminoglycoside phosphotransferase (APT) family kinase protein
MDRRQAVDHRARRDDPLRYGRRTDHRLGARRSEVAPVTRTEATRIVAGALLSTIARATGTTSIGYARAPEPLTGGFWATLYAFELADPPKGLDGPLVLRLMPDAERARREIAFHAAIARAGFIVPEIRLSGAADGELGSAFIVMTRAPGGSMLTGLGVREKLVMLARMPRVLADTMLALHAIDADRVRRAVVEAGCAEASIGLASAVDDVLGTATRLGIPTLRAALDWLRERQPDAARAVVCHGDVHPDNLIVSRGRVTAVVDWTNARLAEREFDVACTAQLIAQWPIPVPQVTRPLFMRIGRFFAGRFTAAYRRGASVDPERLRWYDALHGLRILAKVAESRHPDGRLPAVGPTHPWELLAQTLVASIAEVSDIRIGLPPRRGA